MPQPTLADLGQLVTDGDLVRFDVRVDAEELPVTVSRHAFRIVQECLTNVRKHAPGLPAEVAVTGTAGGELRLSVVNPRSATGEAPAPTGGHGLVGVDERARSVGGIATVTSSPTEHRVEVVLPWGAT